MTTATQKRRTPERTDFLATIIVTAVEGGIGYWSRAYGYEWATQSGTGTSPLIDARATLVQTEEAAEVIGVEGIQWDYDWLDEPVAAKDERIAHLTHDLTVETIAKALGIIRGNDEVKYLSDSMRQAIRKAERKGDNGYDEDGYIDSDVADVIVQVGLFGEVVYG